MLMIPLASGWVRVRLVSRRVRRWLRFLVKLIFLVLALAWRIVIFFVMRLNLGMRSWRRFLLSRWILLKLFRRRLNILLLMRRTSVLRNRSLLTNLPKKVLLINRSMRRILTPKPLIILMLLFRRKRWTRILNTLLAGVVIRRLSMSGILLSRRLVSWRPLLITLKILSFLTRSKILMVKLRLLLIRRRLVRVRLPVVLSGRWITISLPLLRKFVVRTRLFTRITLIRVNPVWRFTLVLVRVPNVLLRMLLVLLILVMFSRLFVWRVVPDNATVT